MKPSLNRKLSLSRSAVSLIALAGMITIGILTGCEGVDYASKNSQAEGACKDTVRAFDSNADAQPYLSLDKLPKGQYLAVGSEVYFENTTQGNNNQTFTSAVQFLVSPVNDRDFDRTDRTLRCQESTSGFTPFTDETTVPHSFLAFNDGSFDMQWLQSKLNFSSTTRSDLTTRDGGKLTNTFPADLNYAFGRYWTGGYHFSRVSTDLFAFYGEKKSAGRIVYGKATFKRVELPRGSH